MPVVTPPSMTAAPTSPDRADRATFTARSIALDNWRKNQNVPESTALAANVFANATDAATSATTATTQAGLATTNGAAQVVLAAAQVNLAATQATAAASSATLSAAAANMKGNWSSLTGALNKPASVYHAGKAWALLSNLVDVTTSQPGVTSDWVLANPDTSNATSNNTAIVTLPVGTATSTLYDRITIDSTRELLLFKSTAAIQAVVWNNTTQTFGTAVLVRTVATDAALGGLLVGTDKVLLVSCPNAATTFEAVVLTFASTVITVGTAATATLPEAMTGNDGISGGISHLGVACGSSYVFGMRLASSTRAIALTVSGTTPTIGTSLSLAASNTGLSSLRGIDTTRLLLIYRNGAGTGIICTPLTVSGGTTLTAGTTATITGGAWRYFTALSTGRWAIVYGNTNTFGAIISVSGTVATASSVQLNAAADLSAAAVVKISDQLIVQCTTTAVNVLTDASGTATAGAAVTTPALYSGAACCGYGTDYAVFSGTGTYATVKLSGNNPVLYEAGRLPSTLTQAAGNTSFDDALSYAVLTSATKSALVAKSASPQVMTFTSTGPGNVVNAAPYVVQIGLVGQSASVMWAAEQPNASTSIRVTRMEML